MSSNDVLEVAGGTLRADLNELKADFRELKREVERIHAEDECEKTDRIGATYDNLMRNLNSTSIRLAVALWMLVTFALINTIVFIARE